jgi:hypothetical protein
MDLHKVPAAGAKVEFRVEGLSEATEPTAAFTVRFAFSDKGEPTIATARPADRHSWLRAVNLGNQVLP